MKKESDLDVLFGLADGFTEKSRQDHEVIILYPD